MTPGSPQIRHWYEFWRWPTWLRGTAIFLVWLGYGLSAATVCYTVAKGNPIVLRQETELLVTLYTPVLLAVDWVPGCAAVFDWQWRTMDRLWNQREKDAGKPENPVAVPNRQ